MSKSTVLMAAAALACTLAAARAMAAPVAAGTVSIAANYVPVIDLTSTPKTYTVVLGATYETIGTGGFAAVSGKTGEMTGTLQFSTTPGATIAQNVTDFLVFNDGVSPAGTYNFSVSSVQDISYSSTPSSSSATLYLLGNTVDNSLGLTSAPTSVTLSFTSTGGSPYSASATLAVPPVSAAPEPGIWALMMAGVGITGLALRRRRDVSTSVLARAA